MYVCSPSQPLAVVSSLLSSCLSLSLLSFHLSPSPLSQQSACPYSFHSHSAEVWRNKVVVFGGLDSDDVPLSRLCTATVMVCGMGGEEREGEGGGGAVLGNCMHIRMYIGTQPAVSLIQR